MRTPLKAKFEHPLAGGLLAGLSIAFPWRGPYCRDREIDGACNIACKMRYNFVITSQADQFKACFARHVGLPFPNPMSLLPKALDQLRQQLQPRAPWVIVMAQSVRDEAQGSVSDFL